MGADVWREFLTARCGRSLVSAPDDGKLPMANSIITEFTEFTLFTDFMDVLTTEARRHREGQAHAAKIAGSPG